MTVRVLFFSVLRDLTKVTEADIALPDEPAPTVGSLLEILYQKHSDLTPWDTRILIAVDQSYADRDTPLQEGQEVAIMPPVQGG